MKKNHDETNTKELKNHKKLIIFVILMIIILIVAFLLYFLFQKYNAQGQVKQFEKDIENNEYNKIAHTLTSNEHKFTKIEAKNFVNYVKSDNQFPKFKKEINNIKDNIKKDEQYSIKLGAITDNKGKPILSIKKDGKKFFFLDKITLEPHLYPVYVKEYDNSATYEYELDDKVKTFADKNNTTKIGKFFVGEYSIDSEKTIKNSQVNGKTNGQLFFNTDNKNHSGKIIVDDSFNQAWFKPSIDSENLLDKDSIKIVINDKDTKYNPNKVYGKYPLDDKPVKVYAVGKVDDKTFKSKPITLSRNHSQQPQNLKFKFNKPEIERYKHDTEDIKKEAKKFMKDYMNHLNKAYKKGDYDYIKNYIEKNSKLEGKIKKATKEKESINYKIKSFDSIERNKNKLTITITKSNNDYKTKGRYELKFDDRNQFKVTNYKD